MSKSLNWWTRKAHRWGAIITAIPLLLVIVSGLLLQLKKELVWVQPPTKRGEGPAQVDWERVLEVAKSVPEAKVESWEDVDRLDVRPGRSLIKIQAINHWEIQMDWNSGQVLSSTYRRSDWIESLHDGSFFGDYSKTTVFLINGLVLLVLWISGLYLWYLPLGVRWKKRGARRIAE